MGRRVVTWLVCGPVGHLWAAVADLSTLLVALAWRYLRSRPATGSLPARPAAHTDPSSAPMPEQVTVHGEQVSIAVELNDSPTARLIAENLPLTTRAQLWGDEIYCTSPVDAAAEPGAQATVEVGDVAYWPPGQAICLFFGPTPASTDDRPVAASPVTVVGRVVDGLEDCRRIAAGEELRMERGSG